MRRDEYVIRHTSQVIYAMLPSGGKAYLKYQVEGNVMKLIETYTPPEFRGKGIAAQLVDYAISLARRSNWLIEPVCSYAVYYFMKNQDKRDILVERYRSLEERGWKQLFENTKIEEEMRKPEDAP